jgi:hypothetical protein
MKKSNDKNLRYAADYASRIYGLTTLSLYQSIAEAAKYHGVGIQALENQMLPYGPAKDYKQPKEKTQ